MLPEGLFAGGDAVLGSRALLHHRVLERCWL